MRLSDAFGASQSDGFLMDCFFAVWEIVFKIYIAKNLVWTKAARDCKVTSLWLLQSRKSVTAKSQACDCKIKKMLVLMQQSN